MAAYAALVSLRQIIHQIKNHPSPPITIHTQQLESLTQNVTFLQEFLDCYASPFAYSDEADPLEIRIADAAYAAEDVIESKIVDRIHARSTIRGKMMRLGELFRGLCKCAGIEDDDLHQVIEEMNLIKKEVMETVAQKPAAQAQLQKQRSREVSSANHAASSSTVKKESMMVGFDEVLLEVLDKLAGGQLNRHIIPITGMGGIGKTTLARNLFENPFTQEYFDICVWTTISQVYNTRETLREVLYQASGESSELSENELGLKLHKYLWGRRYLIVMDDMWSVEVWEKMKFFFPDNGNGSRIIVTTRLSDLTYRFSESYGVGMKFLDEASSWSLFCKTVFGEESVPLELENLELENIGKKIVANCRGLPLSIATIGGLLAKSQRTREYWKHIEENLNSIVIEDNDEYCLKLLRTSYVNLPSYLKPCFLYMGVFEEDRRIRVSTLKKVWVSEGFLRPVNDKCLETIAEEYFKDLVDRNLILVHQLGSNGSVKFCKIHDLLRDLCLREVVNERFYHVLKQLSPPQGINTEHRIVIPINKSDEEVLDAFKSSSHAHARARSLICDNKEVEISGNLRLLRRLKAYDKDISTRGFYILGDVFQLVNSRYLAVATHDDSKLPPSINLLWNLQTLIIYSRHEVTAPIEIWEMSQLRHIEFTFCGFYMPDPPSGHNDIAIMVNLQTLKGVENFYLDENVVKRIPNIKKLYVTYVGKLIKSVNCLSYLEFLSKLETFCCWTQEGCDKYLQEISFPHSLERLKLCVSNSRILELEDILEKLGWLPLLEKLVLGGGTFRRHEWETIEGQFPCLKLLDLAHCRDFKKWTMSDSSHFPLLQELRLHGLSDLEEIPLEIGELATLKSIVLASCGRSVVLSAEEIVKLQEDLYGDQLDLHVTDALQSDRS